MRGIRAMDVSRLIVCVGLAASCTLQLASAQNSFGGPPASPAPPPSKGVTPDTRPGATAASDAERKDFGVVAKSELHDGAMHGPTPVSIPGAQIITTQALVEMRRGGNSRVLVFDVLGGAEALPGALAAVPAHRPGSFDDAVQKEFGQYLQQVTQGSKDVPMVFYCQSVQCWMSYNASLRAVKLGYSRVLWYRGGIEAWKQAGQPVQAMHGPMR